MWRDDFLMRQIHQLAEGLADRIKGETEEVEVVELDFHHLFGAPPPMLGSMSEGALLAMVQTADGVDAARAITLAVGLAQIPEARAKAAALLDAALDAAPSLASPELTALREALTSDEPLH